VAGLFAQAPEFHELAARAFMEGAVSLALVFPSPSSEINPDALAQISFTGALLGVLLLLLLLLFYYYTKKDRGEYVAFVLDQTARNHQ